MRILLVTAVVAVLGVCVLLFADPPAPRAETDADPVEPPAREAAARPEPAPVDIADRIRMRPQSLQTQTDLKRFVADQVAGGPGSVPGLLRRLTAGHDLDLGARWGFLAGRVKEYPTLRAAYIDALAAIPGEEATRALRAALDVTASAAETLQVSLALNERGETSWVGPALNAAAAPVTARDLTFQNSLVELAAKTEPGATAAQVVEKAPRGADGTDPQVMGRALRILPLERAAAAVRRVFLDATVTHQAKGRYLRALCNRPEPEVFRHVRELVTERPQPEDLRYQVAYAAAGAEAFYADENAYRLALTSGDAAAAARIRERFLLRLREAEALVTAALGVDLKSASDPRTSSLRRLLDRHRERVQ